MKASIDLEARIRKSQTVVDLTCELLRYCRHNAQDFWAAINRPPTRARAPDLIRRAQALAKSIDSETVSEADHDSVMALLRDREFQAVPDAIRAHAIATGIDEVLGPRFLGIFRRRGIITLSEDDPFPVVFPTVPELKRLVSNRLNCDPRNLCPQVDGVRHLRLAPPLGKFTVEIDCSEWHSLGHIFDQEAGPLFATGVLNDDLFADFRWNEYTVEGAEYFFGVKPADSGEQRLRLEGIINQASQLGVPVLVLPELCLTEEDVPAIEAAFKSTRLKLLVAGSYHWIREDARLNTSIAFLRGRETRLTHNKFAPFDYQGRLEHLTEDRSIIRLYITPAWSICILICRDFLDTSAQDLLKQLAVSLLLVPSFTPATQPFEAYAGGLTATNQAFVVVANNPAKAGDVAAIFCAPRSDERFHTQLRRKRRNHTPGLCTYDPRTTRTTWVSINSQRKRGS